jgi:tripartite-type tricarboxylate transporter receptor subunit TctC
MKLARRKFLHLAAGAVAVPVLPRIVRAQAYPSRPVRILVGFAPAGNNDIHARLIGQWLSERLGQQFIVENRAGAGGNLATEAVVRATPDGYTLLEAASNDSWNAALYANLKFNFVRDIAPVGSLSLTAGALVVHPSVSAKSVPDLIAFAKANPGKLTAGSSGIGSGPHVYMQLFKSMADIDMLHVPYRGGAPALTDLLAGQFQVYFGTLPSTIEHVRAGKLRALAVTGGTRSEALPNVPTIGEFVPGYEATGWQGLVAPKNTPMDIINKLNGEIRAALSDPNMNARLADLGATPFATTPTEFEAFIAGYTEKWGKVIRAANIKAE